MQHQERTNPMKIKPLSRRRFAQSAAAVFAAPYFVPASALGQDGRPAPSERITVASFGWGMMGPGNTNGLMAEPDCQVVALCDLDDKAREKGVGVINKHYGTSDCQGYLDYREVLARADIDAVMIALPDHWHGVVSVAAANAGKDIYGEKPLAHSIGEQQAIVAAAARNNIVWQTGSWQRSQFNFRLGCMLVRNGYIGKVKRVEVGLPSGHNDFAGTGLPTGYEQPPDHIHYDTWVGPGEHLPYCKAVHHMNWRWNYAFGGGQLLDWIGHHGDIAHWGLGNDDKIGPLEVNAVQCEFPARNAFWNAATKYRIECKYPDDIELVLSGGHDDIKSGTKFIGETGWVHVDRGRFDASDMAWTKLKDEEIQGEVRLLRVENAKSGNPHYRNFLDCIKSRQPTLTPAEVAHRSATPGHLGLISMLTGRKITWDPKTEQIANDPGASQLLTGKLRSPWSL